MTQNPVRTKLFCSLLVLSLAAVATAHADDILLPADPPSQRTVDPIEKWRIGGADDEDILLGLVTAGLSGPDGNTYLLDAQLSQVLVISPAGELVSTLGREGDGPGELRRPHGLFLRDDQTLGVTQGFPGRITLLALDGTPAGSITIGGEASEGGFNFVRKAMFAADHLVVQKGRGTFDQASGKANMELSLSVLDPTGKELAQLVTATQENDLQHRVYDEEKDFSEMNQWTLSPSGNIYTAPEREAYAIGVYGPLGQRQTTLRRPFQGRKRTDDDKKEISSGINIVMNGRRMDIETHVLDTDPVIMGLNTADDGRLFVTHCFDRIEELPTGIGARYDVISPQGKFLEELSLRIPGFDPDSDEIMFLDGKHFLHMRHIKAAAKAARASLRGADDSDDEEDLGDVEPLEIVMYALP